MYGGMLSRVFFYLGTDHLFFSGSGEGLFFSNSLN